MTEQAMDASSVVSAALARPTKRPFTPDSTDSTLALVTFALGFLFIRWVFFSWQGYGVSLFTVLFGGAVMYYFKRKGIRIPREAWFWFGVLQLTGLSYALWQANGLAPWRELFLFCTAVYWILSATETTLLGITSNWLPLDFLHGLILTPFRNFGTQYRSLAALRTNKKTTSKELWPVGLGLFLALIILTAVLPLLARADSGGFSSLTRGITRHLESMISRSIELIVQILLAIPTAAYLFALVAGSAHKRGSDSYKQDSAERTVGILRFLPPATVLTMLGVVCGVYLLFILSQLPYFFSAFSGVRPEGWQVYSEYARNGFFELCSIAVINLSVLTVANLGCQKSRQESFPLRAFNTVLALLTLLLIATAFSKMALYINVYGLSVRRLLPCLFMAFLAVVCAGIVVLQKKQFSIMRLAALVGAVLLSALSLLDPDAFVANYNASRYLSQTLPGFDVAILHRAGPAGVNAAIKVFDKTEDTDLRAALDSYLRDQYYVTLRSAGRPTDTLQNVLARQKLTERGLQSYR